MKLLNITCPRPPLLDQRQRLRRLNREYLEQVMADLPKQLSDRHIELTLGAPARHYTYSSCVIDVSFFIFRILRS